MDISRRHLMVQGALFAATAGCAALLDEASAQSALPERKSLADLPLNDPVMEALRDAVRRMKATPDRLGWSSLASIHGTSSGFNRCPHGNWYFLPWHRGYLLMYERLIRNLTNFPQFALPYWDWSRNRQLPEAFAQARWGGSDNPLYEPSRVVTPMESLPDEFVGPAVMSEVFGAAAFEQFGTSRPSGQNSTDPSWITRRTGVQGKLEQTPHNNVHTFIGGLMGSARSSLDPIFHMHHCNIDRIWAVWRSTGHQDSADQLWLDMRFQNHFFNVDGSAFSPSVKELLDPAPLGYSYGLGAPALEASPAVGALASLVTQVLAGRQEGPGIRTFRTTAAANAEPGGALQAPVSLDAALLSQVVRRPSPPAGEITADFKTLQEFAARGTRALVTLRNIHVTDSERLIYRVFVDCDYLSPSTPITDNHYAGTFGFFGDHAGHGDDRPSVVLDVTSTLKRLYGSTASVPDSIRVQVLPVARGNTAPTGGTVTIEKVEVAFVST